MTQRTTHEIAQLVDGELDGPTDLIISRLATLHDADAGALSFIGEDRYVAAWAQSKASAALVAKSLDVPPGNGRAVIRVDNADLAMAKVLEAFAVPEPLPQPGVHPSAVVAEDVALPDDARVGPGCIVSRGVRLGPGVVLHAGVFLGEGVSVGEGTVLHPRVVIRHGCSVGRGCILHAGVVVGGDGFGYRPEETAQGIRIVKVPHLGAVRLGDEVELGCNTCVDRGKFNDTVIGHATKIDNLVQVGHNCLIGKMVMIAGSTAIAGSVTIGDGALIGGAVACADHVTLGAGCRVAGGAQIMNDVPAGETHGGSPARIMGRAVREYGAIRSLPELMKRVSKLEKAAT